MERDDGRSDAELIASGVDAFGVLYDRHVNDLLRFFLRRTGCAQTAADLTSETFAAALLASRRFVDRGKPGRAWLFTIANRQMNRYIRREVVDSKARKKLGMERIESTTEDLERIERLVDFEPVRDVIDDAVKALPASQLEAIQLRIGRALPYREVAEELGCSEGAARVRVSRGLQTLARHTEGLT